MPLDALTLSAVVKELYPALVGAKIDKIQQPEREELILGVHGKSGSLRLLISARSGSARIHLTGVQRENPQAPPMFCMLLRKHLLGARIVSLEQTPMERVLDLALDCTDELGSETGRHLIVELIGGASNVILTDESRLIIDCLRRVSAETPEKRQVLPGLFYRLPEAQAKLDPLKLGEEDLLGLAEEAARADKKADSWLLRSFLGLSPLVCRELSYRLLGSADFALSELSAEALPDFARGLKSFFEAAGRGEFEPFMLLDAGRPFDFSCMPIGQYGGALELKRCESFSELLESFFTGRDLERRIKTRSKNMLKTVVGARDRLTRKLALQREELRATENRERLRELGDIVSANLGSISRGMRALRAQDLYAEDPEAIIEIKLDSLKTPQQNAAKYYKDYTRAKNAEKFLTQEIKRGEAELDYLESVLEELSKAEFERDLAEIRQELTQTGYLKPPKQQKKQPKRAGSGPLRFVSGTGLRISVGRNNLQNDELTLKSSAKSDIWLHTQKIHGSHVVISTGGNLPDEQSLYEAACLAAYYSQARDGSNVPVDYTLVKHVKKPGGAKPGMVIYTDYKTIGVTPDKELAERLKA